MISKSCRRAGPCVPLGPKVSSGQRPWHLNFGTGIHFHSKEEYPILLLDDVLSELDEGRRRMLLDGMGGKVQTLLTVNDRALARSSGDVVFYEVRSGWVEEDAHEGH